MFFKRTSTKLPDTVDFFHIARIRDQRVSFGTKETIDINFTVTPCISNIQQFNIQLKHTTLKNVELLKHFKISKTAPTCFGLQRNHHQGATVST